MTVDAHGNPIAADSSTADLYDRAVDRLLRYHPDILPLAGALDETGTAMGQALGAYLNLSGTDARDLAAAEACATRLRAGAGNEREVAHADAVDAWMRGDWRGAAATLDQLLVRWPTDLLALQFGHQLDFFVGDAANLRDRPLRTLAELPADDPHAGFVRGMAAFGLEESGDYGAALDAGLAAVDANPDDVWAVHAVVHVHEMRGAVDEGIRFLQHGPGRWQDGNLFTVHNWWHLALYHLEAGAPGAALDIYDRQIHHDGSAGVPIELLDASALLWRLHLDGADVGDRFTRLAAVWANAVPAASWYVFNDVHAVMAFVGAGDLGAARETVARLERWTADADGGNVAMTAAAGLPVARALVAFGEGRDDDVIEQLLPVRRQLSAFGGSHAQRDAPARTLLEAALRAGRFELARSLTAERIGTRPSSVYGWRRRAAALRGLGDTAAAEQAEATASAVQQRFAAV